MLSLWQQPEVVVAFLSACIGAIIWLVRLEGKITLNRQLSVAENKSLEESLSRAHSRIDESRNKHEEMENRILQKMGTIEVTLADISGYLRKQSEK